MLVGGVVPVRLSELVWFSSTLFVSVSSLLSSLLPSPLVAVVPCFIAVPLCVPVCVFVWVYACYGRGSVLAGVLSGSERF